MKLCPQCEFIYEDDQSLCDMDGRELVYDPGPLAGEGTITFRSPQLQEPAAVLASLTTELPASKTTKRQSRRSAIVALAAVMLVALLFVVYYARTHQPRSGNANQASNQTSVQSNQPAQVSPAPPEPASDSTSAPASLASSPEQSHASVDATMSSPIASNSAEGSAADGPASVIIWLTNGSSIKADEAWEKREGIWYRQGGMVTLLKRSSVRAIQRLRDPNPRLKSIAINAGARKRKLENATAQNQSRVAKPETASTKSRVSSFLKKTGRILKKPFEF